MAPGGTGPQTYYFTVVRAVWKFNGVAWSSALVQGKQENHINGINSLYRMGPFTIGLRRCSAPRLQAEMPAHCRHQLALKGWAYDGRQG